MYGENIFLERAIFIKQKKIFKKILFGILNTGRKCL
uniref:Uncharacterized protein n=1 Tax=Siphoviridae sp. ctf8W5 TaxID=2825595 RepID=A0A8S5Q893_9CAUD|nr:MAG TPA: hypothetical protein [Siphoviridae sp. ctf8W5]